jgi:dynein heavy chain
MSKITPPKTPLQVMERRLNAAERLIAGLGSERARWAADVSGLEAARERLVGDCLLCASFLSYCGELSGLLLVSMVQSDAVRDGMLGRAPPARTHIHISLPPITGAFTFTYRQAMLRDTWAVDVAARGIPVTEQLNPAALLTTDVEVAQWASEGLPGDELSVQNGLLTTRTNRWPLCIDPQVGSAAYNCQ